MTAAKAAPLRSSFICCRYNIVTGTSATKLPKLPYIMQGGQALCRYYLSGYCMHGAKCPYLHATPAAGAAAPAIVS